MLVTRQKESGKVKTRGEEGKKGGEKEASAIRGFPHRTDDVVEPRDRSERQPGPTAQSCGGCLFVERSGQRARAGLCAFEI